MDTRDRDEDHDPAPPHPEGECRYLGAFERCPVCGVLHWWHESRFVVRETVLGTEPAYFARRIGTVVGGEYTATREAAIAALRAEEAYAEPVPPRRCPVCGEMVHTWEHNCRGIERPVAFGSPTVRREAAAIPDGPRYADGSEVRVGDTVAPLVAPDERWAILHLRERRSGGARRLDRDAGLSGFVAAGLRPIRDPDELAATLREGDVLESKFGNQAPYVPAVGRGPAVARLADGWTIIRREQVGDE